MCVVCEKRERESLREREGGGGIDVICSAGVLDAQHLSTVRRKYSGCSVRRDRAAPVPAWCPHPPPLPGAEGVCRGCVCVRAFLRSCVREEHGFFPGHPSVLGRRDTFTNRARRARSRQTGTRVCTLLANQGRAAEIRPGRLLSRRARVHACTSRRLVSGGESTSGC